MRWLVSHVLLVPYEDKERVAQKLARLYVNLWWHSELLAAQLQLISIYADVTSDDPKTLIDQVQGIIDGNPETISKPDDSSDDEDLDESIECAKPVEKLESDDDTYDDSDAGQNASPNRDEQASLDMQATNTSDDDTESDVCIPYTPSITISETTITTEADSQKTGNDPSNLIEHEHTDSLHEKEIPSEQIKGIGYIYVTPCTDPAETVLVTKVCRDVLPKKKVLLGSGGFDGWQRKASSVFLLAGRVNADSAILHFLRLCRDFVVMLCNEFDITEEQLIHLSTLGANVEDPLASEGVFEFISSIVETLKENETDKVRLTRLDNFLTTYFGLCLEANLDTPLLPKIIYTLCTNRGELLRGSRPVLLDIIQSDILQCGSMEGKSDPVCETLISSGGLDEDEFPNLAMLDDTLTEQQVDSNLSAACCVIIEEAAFKHITCDYIANFKPDDDTIWELASKAVSIIGDRSQVSCSLQLVAAVAYIRAFTKAVSELIHVTDSKHFKVGSKYYVLATSLNGLLKTEDDARCECNLSLVQVHLLKSLRQQQSLFSLRKLCAELGDPITNLRKIKWQDSLFASRLGYCPMSYVGHYSTAVEALSAWQIQQDNTKITAFISTARESPTHRLALLAAVASMFYFVQSTDGLRDVDKRQAEWLFGTTTDFDGYYRHILEQLLGLADFHGVLQISESTSHESLQIASVIIHLIAIIVSNLDINSTDTALLSFFHLSSPVSNELLPAAGIASSVFEVPHTEELEYYDCVCKLRVAESVTADRVLKCPICDREHRNEIDVDSELHIQEHHQDKSLQNRNFKASSCESIQGLSPIAYRTIDTLVRACVVGGLASRLTTPDQVPLELMETTDDELEGGDEAAAVADLDIVQVKENASEVVDCSSVQDEQKYLTQTLENNWHVIGEIIAATAEKVTLFLHQIVRALTSEIVGYPCLNCIADRIQFEETFANVIDHKAKEIPQCLIQYKQDCLRFEGVDLTCLEAKLEELDAVSIPESELQDQNPDEEENTASIRRLFRISHVASLDHFRSQFANVCRIENKFPFLQLCLQRLEVVQCVRHLPALLEWNSLLIGRLNHMIKRDEAKQMKIVDFLSNGRFHPGTEGMTKASDAFVAFQKAWNQIRDQWNLLTGTSPTFGIITSASSITDCLVDKNDKDCPLRQIISTLQGVQNSFLMNTLAIVKQGNCPTLNFLLKGEGIAAIHTVPLQSAGNAIIQYEWSDSLLVYHDVGTEYGYGSVITYKHTTIERELARLLVLNKAILSEGTVFTQFAFSDELFHACSAILSEIGTTLIQQDLPNELVTSLTREQEHRQRFSNDLLEHLEVILVLLKKTGGDPGSSLDDYIKRWSTQLPGSFPDNLLPEPRDGIKLQHIVSLYETLEDQLVDGVVDSMHVDYRENLPDRGAKILAQNLKPKKPEELEIIASKLRRFIFRFLRSDSKTKTNTNLIDLVMRSTGGTMDCSMFTDVLPDDLEVKHVVKILEFIDKQAEVSE